MEHISDMMTISTIYLLTWLT